MKDLLAAEAVGILGVFVSWACWAWQKRIHRRTVQHQRDTDLATCQAIWDASIDA